MTGIKVSAVGFGAGAVGDWRMDENEAARLLHSALDNGITLIDTARSYGVSEDRIGKHLAHRRHEYALSTKVGYGVEGVEDWTYDAVRLGINQALQKMRTDYIDIVHLHSCPKGIIMQENVIWALEEAVFNGKVRIASYSGENQHLSTAIQTNRFSGMMCSLNICDQRVISNQLPAAKARGMGVIAKRPLANAPWRFAERPFGHYGEAYWERFRAMDLDLGMDWDEVAIRFSAYTYGVDSVVVGTQSAEHLARNARNAENGKLPDHVIDLLRHAFHMNDHHWEGQV